MQELTLVDAHMTLSPDDYIYWVAGESVSAVITRHKSVPKPMPECKANKG